MLALWLLAWSVALADPCILQIPAAELVAAEGHELAAPAHRHGGHVHAQATPSSHDASGEAGHDHSACDHALEHSSESVVLTQADPVRSPALAFFIVAIALTSPPAQLLARHDAFEQPTSSPPVPVFLSTARLRI